MRGFWSFAIRKAMGATLTVFAIVCVNFIVFRLTPGDPIRLLFNDPRMEAEQIQLVREQFGLDRPLWSQFLIYLRELIHGNLGISFWQKRPVFDVIAERIPQTLLLVTVAIAIAVILGTILGAIAGWRSGSKLDFAILSASLAFYSIPSFALGIVLLLVFSFGLRIFPLGGLCTAASGLTGLAHVGDVLWHMFLPLVSLVFYYVGAYVLLTRSAMIDTIGQDYILTARAKGLAESTILRRHALKNALLPVVTMTGLHLAFAVGGVIQVETVFSWPGMGLLVYESIMGRDYPLLQGLFLIFAIVVVVVNLVVDLIYGYIDPRIKTGGLE